MGFNIDADPNNADWIKQSWNLPPYKSDKFYEWLEYSGITLEQFRDLPLYKNMVKKGLIKDDEWVGKGEE